MSYKLDDVEYGVLGGWALSFLFSHFESLDTHVVP